LLTRGSLSAFPGFFLDWRVGKATNNQISLSRDGLLKTHTTWQQSAVQGLIHPANGSPPLLLARARVI